MANDPILHLLGLARKAGKLEIGEEPVGAAARARHAKVILLADNAAPNSCRRAAHFAQSGNVLCLPLPHTKEELGMALGRGSCAMLALLDNGLAAAVVKRLAQQDPERYETAAQILSTAAQRTLDRQRELRRHPEKLKKQARKPWAPPPPKPAPQGKEKSARPPKAKAEAARKGGHKPAAGGKGGSVSSPDRRPGPGKRRLTARRRPHSP